MLLAPPYYANDWVGKIVEVSVPSPAMHQRLGISPENVPVAVIRREDGESQTIFVPGVLSWDLEEVGQVAKISTFPEPEQPTKPSGRDRDKYDAESFASDLDLALNHVRSVALSERRATDPQPHLPPGVSFERAVLRVCECLVLRRIEADFDTLLDKVLDDARVLLVHKNQAYGDSALNPLRVFSKASLKEQLLVRLDDKVSRLARGSAAGEDVAADMLGYLLLVSIAEKREREA